MTSTCAMDSPSCSTQPPPRCMKRTESGEWVTMMSAAVQTGYPLEVAALPVDSHVVGLRDVGVTAQNGRGTLGVV